MTLSTLDLCEFIPSDGVSEALYTATRCLPSHPSRPRAVLVVCVTTCLVIDSIPAAEKQMRSLAKRMNGKMAAGSLAVNSEDFFNLKLDAVPEEQKLFHKYKTPSSCRLLIAGPPVDLLPRLTQITVL